MTRESQPVSALNPDQALHVEQLYVSVLEAQGDALQQVQS